MSITDSFLKSGVSVAMNDGEGLGRMWNLFKPYTNPFSKSASGKSEQVLELLRKRITPSPAMVLGWPCCSGHHPLDAFTDDSNWVLFDLSETKKHPMISPRE
jgi:hypothetical protein